MFLLSSLWMVFFVIWEWRRNFLRTSLLNSLYTALSRSCKILASFSTIQFSASDFLLQKQSFFLFMKNKGCNKFSQYIKRVVLMRLANINKTACLLLDGLLLSISTNLATTMKEQQNLYCIFAVHFGEKENVKQYCTLLHGTLTGQRSVQ